MPFAQADYARQIVTGNGCFPWQLGDPRPGPGTQTDKMLTQMEGGCLGPSPAQDDAGMSDSRLTAACHPRLAPGMQMVRAGGGLGP